MTNQLESRFWRNPPALLACLLASARERGLIAHLVGGAVRDLVLRREPQDLDVITDRDARGLADRTASMCNGRVVIVNRRFSTARIVARGQNPVDILDQEGDLDQDLRRRDFTANAMAWALTPEQGSKPIDLFNGASDAANGLVRAVTAHSVRDHPIRALRAFRLMAIMGPGSSIEPDTLDQVVEASTGIVDEPAETVGRELMACLSLPGLGRRVRLMADSGVFISILPEAMEGLDSALRGIKRLERLRSESGLPGTFIRLLERDHGLLALSFFPGLRGEHGQRALARLRRPRSEARRLFDMTEAVRLLRPGDVTAAREAAYQNGEAALGAALVAACIKGDAQAGMELLRLVARELPLAVSVRRRRLLSGDDLIELGARPGPDMGLILDRLDRARLADPDIDRQGAIDLVRSWIKSRQD